MKKLKQERASKLLQDIILKLGKTDEMFNKNKKEGALNNINNILFCYNDVINDLKEYHILTDDNIASSQILNWCKNSFFALKNTYKEVDSSPLENKLEELEKTLKPMSEDPFHDDEKESSFGPSFNFG